MAEATRGSFSALGYFTYPFNEIKKRSRSDMANAISMQNILTLKSKEGVYGYSWTTLFFGPFPALFREDFITFVLHILIIVIVSSVTFGIGGFLGWVIWSFKYNEYYTLGLIEKGYRFVGSDEQVYRAKCALGLPDDADLDFVSSVTHGSQITARPVSQSFVNQAQHTDVHTEGLAYPIPSERTFGETGVLPMSLILLAILPLIQIAFWKALNFAISTQLIPFEAEMTETIYHIARSLMSAINSGVCAWVVISFVGNELHRKKLLGLVTIIGIVVLIAPFLLY